jgi:hypothetical protein
MGAQQRQMLDERWRCPGQRWTATQAVARPDGGTVAHRHRRGNCVAGWSSGTRSRLLEWWRKEEGPGRRSARRRRGGGGVRHSVQQRQLTGSDPGLACPLKTEEGGVDVRAPWHSAGRPGQMAFNRYQNQFKLIQTISKLFKL